MPSYMFEVDEGREEVALSTLESIGIKGHRMPANCMPAIPDNVVEEMLIHSLNDQRLSPNYALTGSKARSDANPLINILYRAADAALEEAEPDDDDYNLLDANTREYARTALESLTQEERAELDSFTREHMADC